MEQLINQDKFLINFVPEQWDSVTKFRKFKYIPLEDNRLFKRGISTTEEHLAKFRTLAEIANEFYVLCDSYICLLLSLIKSFLN